MCPPRSVLNDPQLPAAAVDCCVPCFHNTKQPHPIVLLRCTGKATWQSPVWVALPTVNVDQAPEPYKSLPQVRAAVFSMIHARVGSIARLPEGSRWLDLFAGTGSIGLEVGRIKPSKCNA